MTPASNGEASGSGASKKRPGSGAFAMKIKAKKTKSLLGETAPESAGSGAASKSVGAWTGESGPKSVAKLAREAGKPLVIPMSTVAGEAMSLEEETRARIARELAAEARGAKSKREDGDGERVIDGPSAAGKPSARPLLAAGKLPGLEGVTDEGERLKKELTMRADDCEASTYENVPVDEFGAALLRGMGWSGSLDADKSFDVQVRHHRLGLGADPKPTEVFDRRGNVRTGSSLDDKPRRKWLGAAAAQPTAAPEPLSKGDVCRGLAGFAGAQAVAGVLCRVLDPADPVRPNFATVETTNGRRLAVPSRALRRTDAEFVRTTRTRSNDHRDDEHSQSARASAAAQWLRVGIRVRVAKRSHDRFRQKATVLDVIFAPDQACRALLQFDDGSASDTIREKHLETALPKDGGRVTILLGPNKGCDGTLVRRDKAAGLAHVQLDDEPDRIIKLSFDDLAEAVR